MTFFDSNRRRGKGKRRLTPKVVRKRVGMMPAKGPGALMLMLLAGTGTRGKDEREGQEGQRLSFLPSRAVTSILQPRSSSNPKTRVRRGERYSLCFPSCMIISTGLGAFLNAKRAWFIFALPLVAAANPIVEAMRPPTQA